MKNYKKHLILLLMIFGLMVAAPTVKADVFPKATLEIEVNYASKRDVHFELLYQGYTKEIIKGVDIEDFDQDLYNYLLERDFDGYVSARIYQSAPFGLFKKELNGGYNLKATYRYPKTFKVLMFDKTNNTILISDEITQEAFDSKMKVTFTEEFINEEYLDITIVSTSNKITEQHYYLKGISGIILRLVLTIVIELFILYLFKYRKKKSYILVGITNFVTHTILTISLFAFFYLQGAWTNFFLIIPFEILIILAETVFYAIALKEYSKGRAVGYAFLANIATILVSFIPFFLF